MVNLLNFQMSCLMTKPTKWHVRPAKTQLSLGIRPVWSESSLIAWRKLGSLATHWAQSEDSDQTGWMVLSWGGSNGLMSWHFNILSNSTYIIFFFCIPDENFCITGQGKKIYTTRFSMIFTRSGYFSLIPGGVRRPCAWRQDVTDGSQPNISWSKMYLFQWKTDTKTHIQA